MEVGFSGNLNVMDQGFSGNSNPMVGRSRRNSITMEGGVEKYKVKTPIETTM